MRMNKLVGDHDNDELIYDGRTPVDAKLVEFSNTDGVASKLEVGSILYLTASSVFSRHAADGEPSVIVAEETEYAADDATTQIPVYTSGTFSLNKIITSTALTAANIETLREKNIILK